MADIRKSSGRPVPAGAETVTAPAPEGGSRIIDLSDPGARRRVAGLLGVKPEDLLAAAEHPDELVAVTVDGRKLRRGSAA